MPRETQREPSGWVQQNVQIPRVLRDMFREDASSKSFGVKRMGTGALALFLGLPDEAQEAILRWIDLVSPEHPEDITPENAWRVFSAAMSAAPRNTRDPTQWFIDRFLDPEVTPPPGQKASDRAAAEEEKRRKAE